MKSNRIIKSFLESLQQSDMNVFQVVVTRVCIWKVLVLGFDSFCIINDLQVLYKQVLKRYFGFQAHFLFLFTVCDTKNAVGCQETSLIQTH